MRMPTKEGKQEYIYWYIFQYISLITVNKPAHAGLMLHMPWTLLCQLMDFAANHGMEAPSSVLVPGSKARSPSSFLAPT